MSTLRPQLDQAKADYHSAQYPGDLATELLSLRIGHDISPPPLPGAVLKTGQARAGKVGGWWWAGGSSAVAAALVGAFMLNQAASTNSSNPLDGSGSIPITWTGTVSPVGASAAGQGNAFRMVGTPIAPAGDRFRLEQREPLLVDAPASLAPSTQPSRNTPRDFTITPREFNYTQP